MYIELLEKFEGIKAKGFTITEQDIFDTLDILDKLGDILVEKRSEYKENKLLHENLVGNEGFQLKQKSFKDETTGKMKSYTLDEIKRLLKDFSQDKDLELIKDNKVVELLEKKVKIIDSYHNMFKKIVFKGM